MTHETFLARQPILNADLSVYGYELLYRGADCAGYDGTDPDQASVQLISNSLLVSHLHELTGGLPAFINVSEGLLVQDLLQVLPADQVVIELLESIRPTPRIIGAVRLLKAAGYAIALDDFVDHDDYAPLVQLADIIKVDFLEHGPAERARIVDAHRRAGLTFLAEKIEDHAQFVEARELGYDLFQGYFFCQPQTVKRQDLPRVKARYLEFLREMSAPTIDLGRLEEVIKSEPSLSAKLLRYLNSAHFGLQENMQSIRQALAYLGERPLKRWATLVALTGLGDDKPREIITTCLVRAYFCEALATPAGVSEHRLDLFLAGMFSAVDALVDQPLDEVLEQLGLPAAVVETIEGERSNLSRIYALARAAEAGDEERHRAIARELGIPEEQVAQAYAAALRWTQRLVSPAGQSSNEDEGDELGERRGAQGA